MEAKAVLRYVRVAPRKARLVVDLIRGKNAAEALTILKFTPRHAAKVIEKVLKSAVANAAQKEMGDVDDLWVSRALVDGGPVMKRMQPRAMGRANIIRKRTSHITLILSVAEIAPKKPKTTKAEPIKAAPAVEKETESKAKKPKARKAVADKETKTESKAKKPKAPKAEAGPTKKKAEKKPSAAEKEQ
ncbi:50S ribosomal protein L22 [Nitrospiraceae bacterium HYJII51-Mn-bac16s-1-B09]|uniref:Large ribosomal subunit protein uL22 n=1 Tax=Candidatus Manganitrophus noduliformans TaxID=2606439 RepID=A0A7X6IAY8_9BACT|nr:50S ribosomal protein L22 [Candidatus Manganitrophus noduliformans]